VSAAIRARALLAGTLIAGAGAVALGLVHSLGESPTTLALLAAGVVATEVFQVPGDEKALDPVERQSFSLSFAVIGAAALIVGPWTAALIAPIGVLVVDSLHGKRPQKIAFNASMFALMGLAGGFSFVALGGHPGYLQLPRDLIAVGGLLVAAYGVETLLLGTMVALSSGLRLWQHHREKVRTEFTAAGGEAGLAVVLACLAQSKPWSIVAVVPLVVAVHQSKARFTTLRRETEHALETLANIVDERDTSTYRHSARVADYVGRLAAALDLPPAEVNRLRWAGRLHDLGKIRVDGTVLRKAGPLEDDELESIRLHPRLSARLLRRFRLAASEAQAVEYHHERVDGLGYYGVNAEDIPLAAHFLIVADAFDAMTSDRPYRRGLPREAALQQIENALGSQFQPVVGKAFVALQRGLDPRAVLSPAEAAELHQLREQGRRRRGRAFLHRAPKPQALAIGGVVTALASLALVGTIAAVAAALVAAVGIGLRIAAIARARRLVGAIDRAAGRDNGLRAGFAGLVDGLVESGPLTWAALVSWSDSSLDGTVELEWRTAVLPPSREAVTSWLIRELESREEYVVAEGAELGGREGHFLAVVLRRSGSPVGSLVLGFNRRPGDHVGAALVRRRATLTELLAASASTERTHAEDDPQSSHEDRPALAVVS
jgi:HD-GYP domain-containing protein (c-di-GMP phosphodiesterase class II)